MPETIFALPTTIYEFLIANQTVGDPTPNFTLTPALTECSLHQLLQVGFSGKHTEGLFQRIITEKVKGKKAGPCTVEM